MFVRFESCFRLCFHKRKISLRRRKAKLLLSAMVSDGKEVASKLSDYCVLKVVQGDITNWSVDGSSDAILRAACYDVPEVLPGIRCPTGEARITLGFNLPASHVIHTVGPVYNAEKNHKKLLESAYKGKES